MKALSVRFLRIFAASLFLAPALHSCAKGPIREEAGQLPVRMIPVAARETAEEVKGSGSLSFIKKFELASPAEGILERLNFREGDLVRKGGVIGRIKNPQVTLAARRAEAAYTQARSALDLVLARLREGEFQAEARILENEKSLDELAQAGKALEEERRKTQNREALYEAGGISDETIREDRFRLTAAETAFLLMQKELEIRRIGLREEDLAAAGIPVPEDKGELKKVLVSFASSALRAEAGAARSNLEAASRERESCRLMEAELVIRSPGSGVVGARYIEEGERIKRDDRILTIMETGSLCAIFPVPESEALKLKKGMAARVIAGGDQNYEGEVDLVSPQADSQSFTFLVRILLARREENPLKPGMFARVVIPLESPRKIAAIPEDALAQKKESSGKVFTVHNNILSERTVVLGALLGDEREIVSGLVPGEVVVLKPSPALKEGVHVSAFL